MSELSWKAALKEEVAIVPGTVPHVQSNDDSENRSRDIGDCLEERFIGDDVKAAMKQLPM